MDHLERGHRVEQLLGPVGRVRHRLAVPVGGVAIVHQRAAFVRAPDDLAIAVLDEVDGRRLHRAALVGENRIGIDQPGDRGVTRTKRVRQIIAIVADPELARGVGDLRHTDL